MSKERTATNKDIKKFNGLVKGDQENSKHTASWVALGWIPIPLQLPAVSVTLGKLLNVSVRRKFKK